MGVETITVEPSKLPTPGHAASDAGGNCCPVDRFDVVVLGGEQAAVTAVRRTHRRGLRVALVVTHSAVSDAVGTWTGEHALRYLAQAPEKTPGGFSNVARRVSELRAQLAPRPVLEELAGLGITVIEGRPLFLRRDALSVNGRELVFRKAVLATGQRVVNRGDESAGEPLDPRWLLSLETLPQRLAILGAGPRACQWAQTFRRLGSEVSLLARTASILPDEDSAAAAVVQEQLAREGVHLLLGCGSLAVQRTGTQLAVLVEREGRQEKRFVDSAVRECDHAADLEGLDLEAAGVAYTAGGVEVNDRLQTTNRRIFAAGGVCGPRFAVAETAETMARLCADNVSCMFARKMSRTLAARCVWTDPEIAEVGLTPVEAAMRQIGVDTYRAEMSEVGAAVLDGRAQGFVLVHTYHGTGRILGATVVAQRAGELIGPLGLMIQRRIPLDALSGCTVCRPSRFEVISLIADYYLRNRPPSRWQLMVEKLWAWWRRVSAATP